MPIICQPARPPVQRVGGWAGRGRDEFTTPDTRNRGQRADKPGKPQPGKPQPQKGRKRGHQPKWLDHMGDGMVIAMQCLIILQRRMIHPKTTSAAVDESMVLIYNFIA